MRKSVTDKGKSFQYQRHTKKRGTERDQNTDDQCIPNERILKIHMKCFKHLTRPLLPVR